ncbi:MAG: TatD family nuclease-associated radical SAM protein [Candidatus Bathyarchaeia archaeon]|jgi:TatD family-associated radical SAM protein
MHRNKNSCNVYWLDNNIYLNITNRCSNNCVFCIKKYTTGIQQFNLKLQKEPTTEQVIEELRRVINQKNWTEIVFCGFGEPTQRLDTVLEVTRWIKAQGNKKVRVDTNGHGYLLNKGRNVIQELKQAGVDKLSVSLNAPDKETYNQICKPAFNDAYENVQEFIKKAVQAGLETEATAVTVPEVDMSKVKELSESLGARFVARQYIPFFF